MSQNNKDILSQTTQDTVSAEVSKTLHLKQQKINPGLALYIEEEECEEEIRKLERKQLLNQSLGFRFSRIQVGFDQLRNLYDFQFGLEPDITEKLEGTFLKNLSMQFLMNSSMVKKMKILTTSFNS